MTQTTSGNTKKLHWTQRPEKRKQLNEVVEKMRKANEKNFKARHRTSRAAPLVNGAGINFVIKLGKRRKLLHLSLTEAKEAFRVLERYKELLK